MNWLILTGAIAATLSLGAFYYLMAMGKNSPQMLLGKDFTMPDVRLRYTPDVLYDTFTRAGEAGRPQMRRYWLYDFGLMLCLTGIMLAVTANVADAGSWIFWSMIALSVIRTVVDVAEDLLFLHLLRSFPTRCDGMAKFAGFTTSFKHLLLALWVAFLFFLLLLGAFNIKI